MQENIGDRVPKTSVLDEEVVDRSSFASAPIPLHKRVTHLLRSHFWLLLIGLLSELFYLFYLYHDFPLSQHYTELTDMGILSNYSHTGFLKFFVFFTLMFALFALAWFQVQRLQTKATLAIILAFGGLFALTSVFVYPMTAIDIYPYIAQSLILVQHHANPMLIPPSQFANSDELMKLAAGFVTEPAPYGPLGLLIQAIPTVLAGRNLFLTLILLKGLCSGLLLATAYIVYKALSRYAPQYAYAGALALAWSPFALFQYSVNSHNDIIMVFFIALSVYALVRERYILALTLLVASSLVKFSSLPLLPLFLLYGFWQQSTWEHRLRYLVLLFVPFLFTVICFLPFWSGPQTLNKLLSLSKDNLYSFNMFLTDFVGGSLKREQAVQIGQILFFGCFLYALWQTRRGLIAMLQGSFIVMFALLAFALSYIQVWYLIWPLLLALFIPHRRAWLVAFLLAYDAILVELVHAYIWPWGGYQNQATFAIVNSMAYLTLFAVPLVFMIVIAVVQPLKVFRLEKR